jgi:uncharacterized protein YkwD
MKKLAFIFALGFVFTAFSQNKIQTIPQSRRDLVEIAFLKLLNNYRKQHELPALTINKNATKGALYKAEYCAINNILTHDFLYDTFDNISRSHIWDEFMAENATYKLNTKNLAAECLNGWIRSINHNRNLLLSDAKCIGFNYAIVENGKVYCFLVITF